MSAEPAAVAGAAEDVEGARPAPAAIRARPFLLALALTTGATLALEVLDTRLLSVLTWYSLAFLVIAMGLSGLTAGAIAVYLNPARWAPERLAGSLSREARRFAWAVPVSYVFLLIVPLRADPVLTTIALFLVFAAAIALPFFPAGAVVAAALSRSPFPVGRTYAVDLIGAALGAPLVPLGLQALGGGPAILAVGVVAALAAWGFAVSGGERVEARRSRRAALLLAGLVLVDLMLPGGLVPLWVKGRPELRAAIALERWNSHSRVILLHESRAGAVFWGKGSKCQAPVVRQRGAEIDGHAATPLYYADGGLESLRFLDCDVTNAVHRIRPAGAAAVIGVGGSRDVQAALLAGHRPVVGLEINGRMLELVQGPFGVGTGIEGSPHVALVHDEARSWLTRTRHRFQVIQMSLIDTWAATGAGAHALSENGLYTVEAWRVFLDRLEPGGVFTVSRWATVETSRLVALAVAALLDRGAAAPADHLALLAAGQVTTILVGRDPLSAADRAALDALATEKGFSVLFAPGVASTAERMRQIVAAQSRAELDAITLLPELDFRPPTDDRPFFFNVIRPAATWSPLPDVTRGTIEGNLLATKTLGLAALASATLTALAVFWPLARRGRARAGGRRPLAAALAYFGLIGVGFMLLEIALLQRLGLVLGHPSYSLIVVLATLVAATGLGSLVSDRLALERGRAGLVFPLVIAGAIVGLAVAWPALAASVSAAGLGGRIGFAVAITAPVGALLGLAFPAGMRLARAAGLSEETPWLWGLNGVGSVVASSAAIGLALAYGFTTVLAGAALCYVALVPAIVVLRSHVEAGR
ncbi:MAG: hypothetical protein IT376_20555 [Polyangiaceae bacterium]|nr:hypothetical protein [Polyangiaceae bacterium]